ncbi:hypothetical protein ACK3TF_004850 [Chlorella vulgaris]
MMKQWYKGIALMSVNAWVQKAVTMKPRCWTSRLLCELRRCGILQHVAAAAGPAICPSSHRLREQPQPLASSVAARGTSLAAIRLQVLVASVFMLQQQWDGLPQQLEQVLTEVQQKPSST